MNECIWNVARDERHCKFCSWDGTCATRQEKGRLSPDAYVRAMNELVGFDVLSKSRSDWKKAHYRFLVAYQMKRDGYIQRDIADVLKRDRSTVCYALSMANTMLSMPYVYGEENDVWKRYTKIINLLKK